MANIASQYYSSKSGLQEPKSDIYQSQETCRMENHEFKHRRIEFATSEMRLPDGMA